MRNISIPKSDLKKIFKLFNRKIGLLFILLFGLYFDGTTFGGTHDNAQTIVNVIAIIGFLTLYIRSAPRVKELMIYALILGLIGEQILSIVLNMWTYRLGNMPLYAPLGHAAIYGRTFAFSKAGIVQQNKESIVKLMSIFIILYALAFLFLFNDIFGFVMTIAIFLLLIKRPNDRVFFLTMYIVVIGVEIAGTAFGCWYWPETAFNVFSFLPSHNPPSGISLFYFLLDIGCFIVYTQRHKITWARVKNIRSLES
jgi:uncharacterized membrane protein YeaQ/YmgE (transglycosylase-associated protein family)